MTKDGSHPVRAEAGLPRNTALAGFQGIDFEALARAHGTPFYVYDADDVIARIERVRHAFQDLVKVYYAVKCNPNLQLLRTLRGAADGVDISSGGELEQALLAGFEAQDMSFAGPAKTNDELERAVALGVRISVESIAEIDTCAAIAARLGRQAHLCLRVNPNLLNRAFGLKMGGRAVQFGIEEDALGAALATVRGHDTRLSFHGIHVYAGSQCFEPEGAMEGVRNTLEIVAAAERQSGLHCKVVNLGGGFGVSHNESAREMEIEPFAAGLVAQLRAFRDNAAGGRQVIFELGRWLTANAGIYVARVIYEKTSRGKTFYVLDGGLNHHLAAAGTFGAAFRTNYPVRNLTRPDEPSTVCTLAGPSCNPTDLPGIDVTLPRPEEGDLIGILKSGSYSLTASPILFLGRATPAEVVRHRGHTVLGRRRYTILDFN